MLSQSLFKSYFLKIFGRLIPIFSRQVTSAFVGIMTLVVMTNLVGVSGVGLWTLLVTIGYFPSVIYEPVFHTISRFSHQNDERERAILFGYGIQIFVLSVLIICCLVFLLASVLSDLDTLFSAGYNTQLNAQYLLAFIFLIGFSDGLFNLANAYLLGLRAVSKVQLCIILKRVSELTILLFISFLDISTESIFLHILATLLCIKVSFAIFQLVRVFPYTSFWDFRPLSFRILTQPWFFTFFAPGVGINLLAQLRKKIPTFLFSASGQFYELGVFSIILRVFDMTNKAPDNALKALFGYFDAVKGNQIVRFLLSISLSAYFFLTALILYYFAPIWVPYFDIEFDSLERDLVFLLSVNLILLGIIHAGTQSLLIHGTQQIQLLSSFVRLLVFVCTFAALGSGILEFIICELVGSVVVIFGYLFIPNQFWPDKWNSAGSTLLALTLVFALHNL